MGFKSYPSSCHPISCGWGMAGSVQMAASTQVLDNANASDGSVLLHLLGACVQVCLP